MGEVIPNGDPRDRTPELHAAPDALEAREGFDGPCRIDAGSLRRGDRGDRVLQVVLALKVQLQGPNEPASIEDFKTPRPDHACTPANITHAKPFHCAPAAARQDAVDHRVGAVDYQFSGSRYRSDEMVKLGFNRRKVVKDVGMVELYVVQNRESWPVMDHFGTLVEEGRIVFIGFDHEIGSCSQPGGYAEVDRNATNEEPRN